MQWLKQSTSITARFGPFVDEDDGKTAETGLTISQADIRLSKNGGDFAQTNDSSGATHDENGWYSLTLDATDTNTLGRLDLAIHESGALPVWREFMVVPANVWDSLFGSDRLQVHTAEMSDDLITASVFDESTAYPIKSADSGSTQIARTGADGDTLETLSDEIAVVDSNVDAILADTGTDGVVLANDAITSAKFDETTAFPVKAADSGSTYIARTGADSDTLETLSDQIDDVPTGSEVQAQLTAAGYEAGNMNFVLFCTYDETITGLTIPANWSKLYYSVKDSDTDTDNDAILRLVVTNGGDAGDGLLRIMGQAPTALGLTAADGALTASQANGTLNVVVSDDALSVINASSDTDGRKYDVKVVEDDDTSFQLASDDATFTATRTRATS